MVKYIIYKPLLTAFFVLINVAFVFAQNNQKLSGEIVYGDTPVSNVSISVEGSNISPVYSDVNGEFSIDVPSLAIWILVQPIDEFKYQKVNINNRNSVNIVLVRNDFNSLEDAISTPLGDLKRKNILTGFASVNTSTISSEFSEGADQILQGKVAGLNVVNRSGMPGDGTFSTIRGISSIHTNAQPLYIVDGLPFEHSNIFLSLFEGYADNPLSSINPLDITDVTVLKGSGAGAKYGSKASKGIVYIRTLKPDKTTTTIDFRALGGSSFAPKSIPLLDATQYRAYANEIAMSGDIYKEEELGEIQVFANNPQLSNYYRFNNETDWQNEVFTNAIVQDYHLAIRGGDAIAKYGISIGYANYEGIVKNTDYDRITMRMVGAFNVMKWLKMDISTSFSMSTSSVMEAGLAQSTSPIFSALHKSPFYAPYKFDENGNKLKFLDDAFSDIFGICNPTAIINGFEGSARTHKLTSSANLEAEITKDLSFKTMLGINLNRKRESKFVPSTGILPNEEIYNYGQAGQNHYNAFFNDNRFVYAKKLGNSYFTTTAGFRLNSNNFEFDLGTGQNMHPSNQIKGIQNGVISLNSIGGDFGSWNWISTYADINYNINDKYLFNFSASIDGSSRTGKDSDYDLDFLGAPSGIFYSGQAGWRISDEAFLIDANWLDDLKLRASFGKTGNDDIGNYSSKSYYVAKPYRSIIGFVSEIVPNTKLKYEELTEMSAGLDLAVFGQRLQISTEFYSINTNDLLVYEKLPVLYGVDYLPKNDGSMKTSGWDVSLLSRVMDKKVKLDLGINIGSAKSKIAEMSTDSVIIDIPGGSKAYIKGQPAGVFFGYETNGIYETTGQALTDGYFNEVEQPFRGGDVRFVNHSGTDKIINDNDRTIIGDPTPDFFGGFFANINWKNWTLNTAFQFSVGNDVYNYTRQNLESMSIFNNQSAKVLNRWVSDGDITDIPRLATDDPLGNSRFSDRWIEDGSYLRLKNITLNYSFPNPKGLNSINVFITAQNVLTLTKYLGYDPEFGYSNSQVYQGVDYGLMPQSRKIMLGIKLGL